MLVVMQLDLRRAAVVLDLDGRERGRLGRHRCLLARLDRQVDLGRAEHALLAVGLLRFEQLLFDLLLDERRLLRGKVRTLQTLEHYPGSLLGLDDLGRDALDDRARGLSLQ